MESHEGLVSGAGVSAARRVLVVEDPTLDARVAQAVLNSLYTFIGLFSTDGVIVDVNRAPLEAAGLRREDLIGRRFVDMPWWAHSIAERQRVVDAIARAARGESTRFDTHVRRMRGDIMYVDAAFAPLVDERGVVTHVIGSGVDVTARRQAEQARARSEAQLSEAQRLAHVGSWEWDVVENRVAWSEELYRIYGLDHRTFAATYQAYLERVHPDDRAASHRVIEHALREARPFVYEHRVVRPDGEIRMLDTRGEVFTGPDGNAVRMVGSCLDVTDQWIANDRLRALGARLEAAREEERRLLARELHDQVGQALIVLKLELSLLGKDAAAASGAPEMEPRLASLQRLLDETLETTRRLSAELRPPLLDEMGLPAVIEARAQELQARSGLAFTLNIPPPGALALDPGQALGLYRVLQEALTNVVRHAGARQVTVRLHAENDEVVLAIADDGRGITAEDPARAGSLGLLGMRERMTALGGRLTVEGVAGAGTTVTARVPRRDY